MTGAGGCSGCLEGKNMNRGPATAEAVAGFLIDMVGMCLLAGKSWSKKVFVIR